MSENNGNSGTPQVSLKALLAKIPPEVGDAILWKAGEEAQRSAAHVKGDSQINAITQKQHTESVKLARSAINNSEVQEALVNEYHTSSEYRNSLSRRPG